MSIDLEKLAEQEYKYGFFTDVEQEIAPKGLNENTIKLISSKKEEPEWLLEWRLKAYRHWLTMKEPRWAHVTFPPIDYQNISYYAAPKAKASPKSLDEIDPEIRATYEKLGIPLDEQKMLAGVAVDAVFDSVSVITTFKEKLAEAGVIFCSISEAVREHPELVKKYLGFVVPPDDNFYAALNSAVFTDGSFVYVPKGVRCPMELSTYFRINAESTGQFERTLIIAEEGSYVSYLEGCTAPKRDENQLHAAVVELIAHKDATIKYSTIQNWYPGNAEGEGGIYNFVTKRGRCIFVDAGGDGLGDNVEISELYPGRRRFRRGILLGRAHEQTPAGGHGHENDTYRKEHDEHYSVERHFGGTRSEYIQGPGTDRKGRFGSAQLHAVRFDAYRGQMRGAYIPVYRGQEFYGPDGARGLDVQDRRRPDLLLPAARPLGRGRCIAYRKRLLQRGLQGAAVRVRRRGGEASEHQP